MMTDCNRCRSAADTDFGITMAFQPIFDFGALQVFAYEALVRGRDGEGAGEVLSRVTDETRYQFDQACRVTAISQASALGLRDAAAAPFLSINFLPNAVYEPRACIRKTLSAALESGFPTNRILFEFTESERLDTDHLLNILRSYRSMGFSTAIDDFGAGYAGLGLLSAFQPDFVKLDMELIRGIDTNSAKQAIVRDILNMTSDLGITPVCEGIETPEEFEVLYGLGVRLMQGFLFARPELDRLPALQWRGRPQEKTGEALGSAGLAMSA